MKIEEIEKRLKEINVLESSLKRTQSASDIQFICNTYTTTMLNEFAPINRLEYIEKYNENIINKINSLKKSLEDDTNKCSSDYNSVPDYINNP